MSLTFRQIQIVAMIMETRSISAAAERLHVSQPALTKALQVLEDEIGARVFDRGAGGIFPTAFGEAILRHAGEVRSGFNKIKREMELLRSDEIGTLTIGAGLYSTELWLGKTIAKLMLENPQQKFEIMQRDWLKVMQMVKENRIDIGLSSISHAAMDPAFKTELLKEVRVHFICRAGHPLDNGRDPTMDDLRRYPYVGVVMSKRQADHFGGNAGKFGDIDPQSGILVPAIETASVAVINQIVIDTDAIGLAPEPLLENMIAQGKIVALGRIHTPWLTVSVGFVYLRDRPLASVIKTFIKTVCAVEDENYAVLEGTQV